MGNEIESRSNAKNIIILQKTVSTEKENSYNQRNFIKNNS
jgi:hypothetical protein